MLNVCSHSMKREGPSKHLGTYLLIFVIVRAIFPIPFVWRVWGKITRCKSLPRSQHLLSNLSQLRPLIFVPVILQFYYSPSCFDVFKIKCWMSRRRRRHLSLKPPPSVAFDFCIHYLLYFEIAGFAPRSQNYMLVAKTAKSKRGGGKCSR